MFYLFRKETSVFFLFTLYFSLISLANEIKFTFTSNSNNFSSKSKRSYILYFGSLLYHNEKFKRSYIRSSRQELFLGKGVLKICSKFTGEHPCQSVISIKLLCSFIEITLQHGCFPVILLHISKTPFPSNTTGWLLLLYIKFWFDVVAQWLINWNNNCVYLHFWYELRIFEDSPKLWCERTKYILTFNE